MSSEPLRAYQPQVPAKRPGGKPAIRPAYRVLVHRKYLSMWERLPDAVGLQQAQQFWDHIAQNPGGQPATAGTSLLRGKAGAPAGDGWSRTVHYELSSKARANYQFHDNFITSDGVDAHPVVFVLTLDFSSH